MAVPSYRLLVVDDSKRDTLLLERILQQASDATFTVTHMESAQTGLEELSTQAYDLVLLDYYLPDMDGLAFLEEKHKRGLTAPVIMLTAFGQERLPVAALQAGADAVLAASIFHDGRFTVAQVKAYLSASGMEVRL